MLRIVYHMFCSQRTKIQKHLVLPRLRNNPNAEDERYVLTLAAYFANKKIGKVTKF